MDTAYAYSTTITITTTTTATAIAFPTTNSIQVCSSVVILGTTVGRVLIVVVVVVGSVTAGHRFN